MLIVVKQSQFALKKSCVEEEVKQFVFSSRSTDTCSIHLALKSICFMWQQIILEKVNDDDAINTTIRRSRRFVVWRIQKSAENSLAVELRRLCWQRLWQRHWVVVLFSLTVPANALVRTYSTLCPAGALKKTVVLRCVMFAKSCL